MPVSYDDEVLPITPVDEGTPFVFAPGAAAPSVFDTPLYPTQDGTSLPGKAGELRGIYGKPGELKWHPEWSRYRAVRDGGNVHWGVDIYAPVGQPLIAVVAGELSFASQASGLGLYARLAFVVDGKRYTFHYGHLSRQSGADRSVPRGEVIGFVGCSGNADYSGTCSALVPGKSFSSSHVHFALLPPQPSNTVKRANPLSVLSWDIVAPPKPPGVAPAS